MKQNCFFFWAKTLTLSMIVKISDIWVALDNFVVRHIQLKIVTNTKTTIFREPPQILSQIRIIDWFVKTPAKQVPYHCSNGNASSKFFSSRYLRIPMNKKNEKETEQIIFHLHPISFQMFNKLTCKLYDSLFLMICTIIL